MDIDDWDDDASDRRSFARVIKNIVKSKTAPAQAVKAKRVPANMMTKRVQGTEKRAAGLASIPPSSRRAPQPQPLQPAQPRSWRTEARHAPPEQSELQVTAAG